MSVSAAHSHASPPPSPSPLPLSTYAPLSHSELEGAGLLGLPYAFRLAGWGALACLLLVGTMAGFTGFALAMCMYDGSGRRVRQSYAAVGKACYGAAGERAVVVVQMLNLVSVGVVYLVLLGETMSSVGLPILRPGETQSPDGAWAWLPLADQRLWTLTATAAVFPTVHLGGYKKLSFMSGVDLDFTRGI